MTKREKLLAQSEVLKDCVKRLKETIRAEQKRLEYDQKEYHLMGTYEDCGDFYRDQVTIRKARIEALVEQKIRLEKYAKKLKHMANDVA